MNRLTRCILALSFSALAVLSEPARAQQPASAEPAQDDAAQPRQPKQPRRGHRPGQPPSQEQVQQMLEFAKGNLPMVYQRLESLRTSEPDRYQRTLRRMLPRIAYLMKMPPEQRKAHIELSRLRMEIFKAARRYSRADDEKEKQALREKLRALLGEKFELEQTLRRAKLQELEKQIDRLRDEINQRSEQKDKHIAAQLDRTIEFVRNIGETAEGRPGRPRRRARPEADAPQSQPAE